MPILWKHLFRDMQQTILGLYHSMGCLCSDFDTVHISMDVSRILTACTTLLAVFEGIVAKCSAKFDVALPSMAGSLACFLICNPYSMHYPASRESYCHAVTQVGLLPIRCLREYLRSLVRFAADSFTAPNWCQHAATISHRYWKDDYIVAVWVETLEHDELFRLDFDLTASTNTSTKAWYICAWEAPAARRSLHSF
jgi:hypothetical protein